MHIRQDPSQSPVNDSDEAARKVVLILAYGNPWEVYPPREEHDYRLRKITYMAYLDGGEHFQCGRTTLPILYEIHRPDRVILIVQDTVVYRDDLECYEELICHVRDLYERFVLEEVCRGICSDIKDKLKIVVAPGVGRTNNQVFNENIKRIYVRPCGELADFYGYVLSILALEFIDLIEDVAKKHEPGIDLEVVLDLSHGTNYMPALIYRSVRELLPIISILPLIKSSRLYVYNSDPVLPETREVILNRIEEITIKSGGSMVAGDLSLEAIEHLKLLSPNHRCIDEDIDQLSKKIYNEIMDIINKHFQDYIEASEKHLTCLEKKLSAFAGSIVNGLPLVAIYTTPKINIKEFHKDIFKLYQYYTKINKSQNSIEIVRKTRITVDLVALFKILTLSEIIRTAGIEAPKREATLEDLKEVKKRIFSVNKRTEAIIDKEISNIEKRICKNKGYKYRCEEKCDNEWLSLKCILGKGGEGLNDRNFLAHAGLERNVTCYRIKDHSKDGCIIELKYSEECIGEIYEISSTGLRKI